MAEKIEYLDVAQRIRVFMSVPWFYRSGERVRVYSEGFAGRGLKNKGPSYESLRKYGLGEQRPSEATLIKIIEILMTQMKDPPPLSIELMRSSTPIRELYRVLGVNPEKAEEMSFTLWAQHEANLCKAFTFESPDEAEKFSQSHCPGLYLGERRPLDRANARPDKFALAVFGKVPASTHDNNKKFFIPVFLTIRSSSGTSLYSYRGAIGPLSRGLEWAFFQEGQGMLDRIRIMTSDSDSRFPQPYVGSMLTITEGPVYQPITYEVSIRKYAELTSWTATSHFLTKTPTPTSNSKNREHQSSRRNFRLPAKQV